MALADFVIITPLSEERDAVLEKLGKVCTYKKLDPSKDDIRTYYWADLPVISPEGTRGTYGVVVMPLLGMGRPGATAATVDAIRRWQPEYIILVGIAGGNFQQKVGLGDILAPGQIVDYELQKWTAKDVEVRWQVYPTDQRLLGAIQNFTDNDAWHELITTQRPTDGLSQCHRGGAVASGDKVDAVHEVFTKYRDIWPKLLGIEMEAGGVGIATIQAAHPPGFFMIRGISDLADEEKDSEEVKKWRSYACDVAASYTIAFLRSGPVPLQSNGLDLTKLTDMLQRSGRASNASQRSLCLEIGIDPNQLAFLNATPHDFSVQLIDYLNKTENRVAIVRLCKAIKLLLGESLRKEVCQIQSELEYKS
jgi:adenosylhomocysteine nucleosidase